MKVLVWGYYSLAIKHSSRYYSGVKTIKSPFLEWSHWGHYLHKVLGVELRQAQILNGCMSLFSDTKKNSECLLFILSNILTRGHRKKVWWWWLEPWVLMTWWMHLCTHKTGFNKVSCKSNYVNALLSLWFMRTMCVTYSMSENLMTQPSTTENHSYYCSRADCMVCGQNCHVRISFSAKYKERDVCSTFN